MRPPWRMAWLAQGWLAMALFVIWWGGFTFYALVVVPTGHQVLHSTIRQGFITQSVTYRLNVLGVATLLMLLWHRCAQPTADSRTNRRLLSVTWLVMAGTLVGLFWLHPYLDQLLDQGDHRIIDEDRFYQLHRWYLLISAVQWLAGAIHLGTLTMPRTNSTMTTL